MKKNKMVSKVLLTAAALGATSVTATSCSDNSIEQNFFDIKTEDLTVSFCDIGASIYAIKYKDTYITYAPKNKKDFINIDYYGKIVGRCAGRIAEGKITVEGKEYELQVNEEVKDNSLHGGTDCFSTRKFKRYVEERIDAYIVSFNYQSPDNEAGYPELLDCWVTYTIYKDDPLIETTIAAKTTGTTPVNITNHPYFRLANTGTILEHELTIPANQKATYDDSRMRIIGLEGVNGNFDFQTPKAIGKDIEAVKEVYPTAAGYDNLWKFNNIGLNTIVLRNPNNRLRLEVTTDANSVCLYTNNYPKDNLLMITNDKDDYYKAIAIEPESYFLAKDTSMLNIDSDSPFTRYISYRISDN